MIVARLGRGLAACLLLLACVGPARAETRLVAGDALVLTHTLSSHVAIDTDATLSGEVRVSADGSLACLSILPGHAATIGTSGCHDDLESLRISVPTGAAVALTGTGDGGARIGDLGGPLVATISGGYDLTTGHLGRLTLSMHGGEDVAVGTVDGAASIDSAGGGNLRIARLRGALGVRRRGSGDLSIDDIESPDVTIDSVGSGDVLIGGGAIAGLRVRMVGSGDLSIAARVAGGEISATGGGDAKLAEVTGTVKRSAGGGSTVAIGGADVATDVMIKVAKLEGDAGTRHVVTVDAGQSRWLVHAIMLVLLLAVGFFVWRIVQRRSAAGRRDAVAGGPLHPGVASVCDTLARLEQRLGRLEGYVTTREFELNRKFRELGPL